jgi:hypothetical protein
MTSETPKPHKANCGETLEPALGNGPVRVDITPIHLLSVILKCVLEDRISDDEAGTICSVYYRTVRDWWGE